MKDIKPALEGKCPINVALEIFGDRWSLLIIRDLVFKKKQLYGEFARSPEKISTNILADRLSKLTTHGIIEKRVDRGARPVYRLTDKGLDLISVLLEITAWSARHYPQDDASDCIIHGAPPALLHRLEKDRERLIEQIRANVDEQESEAD